MKLACAKKAYLSDLVRHEEGRRGAGAGKGLCSKAWLILGVGGSARKWCAVSGAGFVLCWQVLARKKVAGKGSCTVLEERPRKSIGHGEPVKRFAWWTVTQT